LLNRISHALSLDQLESTILRLFPSIPKEDLHEILREFESGTSRMPEWLRLEDTNGKTPSIDIFACQLARMHLVSQYLDPWEDFGGLTTNESISEPLKESMRSGIIKLVEEIMNHWRQVRH